MILASYNGTSLGPLKLSFTERCPLFRGHKVLWWDSNKCPLQRGVLYLECPLFGGSTVYIQGHGIELLTCLGASQKEEEEEAKEQQNNKQKTNKKQWLATIKLIAMYIPITNE